MPFEKEGILAACEGLMQICEIDADSVLKLQAPELQSLEVSTA